MMKLPDLPVGVEYVKPEEMGWTWVHGDVYLTNEAKRFAFGKGQPHMLIRVKENADAVH